MITLIQRVMKRSSLLLAILLFSPFLWAQNAPETTISSFYGCTPGVITVPVKVNNFSGIGAFSLDLQYDPATLSFIQGIKNSALYGSFLAGDNVMPNGMHHVVISWFGPSSTLANGSTLLDLKFNFLGGTTSLTWLDDGSSCEYADAAFNPLADTPTGCFYRSGTVSADKLLTLNLFLQGLYNPTTHSMVSAVGDASGACNLPMADYVTFELHNAANYSVVEFTSSTLPLSTTGQLSVLVPASKSGSYYLTVKNRNSIQTVSALPVSLSASTTDYSFVSSASRAYGNNMIQMDDGNWALFTGDTNQDDIIDSGDMIMLDNDVSNFVTGYVPTDCNGDGLTDSSDMITVDNNSAAFVTAVFP